MALQIGTVLVSATGPGRYPWVWRPSRPDTDRRHPFGWGWGADALTRAPAESRGSRQVHTGAAAAPSTPCPGSRTATSPPADGVVRQTAGTAAPASWRGSSPRRGQAP